MARSGKRNKRGKRKRTTDDNTPIQSSADDLAIAGDVNEPNGPLLPKSKRRRRILLAGFLLCSVFVFVLPNIVAVTPLRQMVVEYAFSKFNGRIQVESASMGWLSPIKLTGIEAKDEHDVPLLMIECLTTEKSLLALISGKNLGRLYLKNAEIDITLRSDGSNLEDAIRHYLARDSGDKTGPPLVIDVAGGTCSLAVENQPRIWNLNHLTGELKLYQSDAPLTVKLSGSVSAADVKPGQFQVDLVVDPGHDELSMASGSLEVTGHDVSIGIASPIISRFVEPAVISGNLNGEALGQWSDGGRKLSFKTKRTSIGGFQCALPKRFGNDQIHLGNVHVKGDLEIADEFFVANDFSCDTDIGNIRTHGKIGWQQLSDLATAGTLPDSDFEANGKLDIARLATMFSNTIPLQPGLSPESGQITFQANSHRRGPDRRAVFNVEVARLSAERDGRRLYWNQPVRFAASIRQSETATIVESLDCRTHFLNVQGSATADRGDFTATGDLATALNEAKKFLDLGQLRLAGKIDGQFAWQFGDPAKLASSDDSLRIGGRFTVVQPMISLPGKTRWQKPELHVLVQAGGDIVRSADGAKSPVGVRIDYGNVELKSGTETLVGRLVQPVENPGLQSVWFLNCKVNGSVENLIAQLKTFVPLSIKARGNIHATAVVEASPNRITIRESDYEVTNFDYAGFGINIEEPKMIGTAKGSCEISRGRIIVDDMTFASSTVSARAQQMELDGWGRADATMRGIIAFRADVNRLAHWFSPPVDSTHQTGSNPIQWFGSAQGTIQLLTGQHSIDGNVAVQLNDLIAARPAGNWQGNRQPAFNMQNVSAGKGWTKLFEERRVTLESELQLARSLDRVVLNNLTIDSTAARVDVTGSIEDLTGAMVTDIRGNWTPRWERIYPLLQSYLGNLASFQGVTGKGFEVRGPLIDANPAGNAPRANRKLQVAAALAWERGQVIGLPIGPSHIALNLDQSIVTVETGSIPIGGGAMNLAPRFDLRGPTPILELPAGKKLENVHLTADVCRRWLMYVAPLFAQVTSAEGKFSIITNDVRVDLDHLHQADVAGAVMLHSARVGPGPLGSQLVALVAQIKSIASGSPLGAALTTAVPTQITWISMPEQNVPFRVMQQRVYHNGLTFKIDNVTVRTRGSVGLEDQSLQLVADIPILEGWLGDQPLFAGLKGQTLQIPIAGTVGNPRLDVSVVERLSQQLFQQATTGAAAKQLNNLIQQGGKQFENELIKGLDKIFGPKK